MIVLNIFLFLFCPDNTDLTTTFNIGIMENMDTFQFDSHGEEILANRNPYGQTLPEHADSIIKDLFTKLQLDVELELNYDLLKKIDSLILEKNNFTEFVDTNFLALITLVGETANRTLSTNWYMELSDDNQTWNPLLIYNGQFISYHIYLFEDYFLTKTYFDYGTLSMAYDNIRDIININLKKK